jgi:hypothetical protein
MPGESVFVTDYKIYNTVCNYKILRQRNNDVGHFNEGVIRNTDREVKTDLILNYTD